MVATVLLQGLLVSDYSRMKQFGPRRPPTARLAYLPGFEPFDLRDQDSRQFYLRQRGVEKAHTRMNNRKLHNSAMKLLKEFPDLGFDKAYKFIVKRGY